MYKKEPNVWEFGQSSFISSQNWIYQSSISIIWLVALFQNWHKFFSDLWTWQQFYQNQDQTIAYSQQSVYKTKTTNTKLYNTSIFSVSCLLACEQHSFSSLRRLISLLHCILISSTIRATRNNTCQNNKNNINVSVSTFKTTTIIDRID